jgi:hypothetical protein
MPGKNSCEQAESASGTHKKHEWSGATRNPGHFLSNFLKGNNLRLKVVGRIFSPKIKVHKRTLVTALAGWLRVIL